MNEDRSTRYHRHRRWAEELAASARVLALAGCIGLGFSPWLAATAGRLTGLVSVATPLAATLVIVAQALTLSAVCDLAAFPVIVYSRFWLERKYRQAQPRLIVWLRGYSGAISLHAAVWSCCALTVYVVIGQWPTMWWLVTGGTFAIVTALTHLGPVVIFPWLYELRPLDRPGLQARLDALTRRVGTPLTAIQEWRFGLETGRPNAALVGIRSTRQVLLSDALLADYSDDEIEVVLAHELAHHVNHDIWKTMVYETAVVVAAAGVAHLVIGRFGAAFGMAGPNDVGGLPLLVLIGGAVVMVLAPVRNVMSRQHERRADQYALAMTRNPAALVSSLRRFGEQTLAEERPSRVVEWLFYTHPPMADRLSAARAATEDTRR